MAHPLRLRLIGSLRKQGPATASELGRLLGESSGATSYHLRILEKYGFVEDDPARNRGRERWWRAVDEGMEWSLDTDDPGEIEADRALGASSSPNSGAGSGAGTTRCPSGTGLAAASSGSDRWFELTPDELRSLADEVLAVLERYNDRRCPVKTPSARSSCSTRFPSAGTRVTTERLTRRFVLLRALRWLPLGLVLPFLVITPQARGLSLGEIGAVFAVHSAVAIVLEIPSGALADVVGRRRVLLAGASLTALSLLIFAVAGSIGTFMASVGLLAAGRALISGSLEAWYVDSLRRSIQRRRSAGACRAAPRPRGSRRRWAPWSAAAWSRSRAQAIPSGALSGYGLAALGGRARRDRLPGRGGGPGPRAA